MQVRQKVQDSVNAVQYTGSNLEEVLEYVPDWLGYHFTKETGDLAVSRPVANFTLCKGDWLICGEEYKVCTEEEFKQLYDTV